MGVRDALLAILLAAGSVSAQDQGPTAKPFVVTLHRYAFDPPRIEVNEGDLVKIELRSDDIAHSLTIDDYRISKRVSADQPVTFEFRADRAGTFPYYCNLQIEDGCRKMRGQLIVQPSRLRRFGLAGQPSRLCRFGLTGQPSRLRRFGLAGQPSRP